MPRPIHGDDAEVQRLKAAVIEMAASRALEGAMIVGYGFGVDIETATELAKTATKVYRDTLVRLYIGPQR